MPPSRRYATERAAPRLSLSIQLGERIDALPASRSQLRRWVAAALERDCAFTLRFVGTREGRALNQAFRGRDYATNVLTFEYGADEGGDTPGGVGWTGGSVSGSAARSTPGSPDAPRAETAHADIVICLPVVRREAREQRKAPHDHLAHLVVHGALHAQGWDHERGADEAARMEAREREILARFRIGDPYAEK